MKRRSLPCLLLLIAGCTGTDFIADPPTTMDEEPAASLTISPDMVAVEVGATRALDVIFRDAMGEEVTDVAVSWSVSNEVIASVDNAGLVSGLSVGQVRITAMVGDVVSEPVVVGVVADPAQVALVRIAASRVDLTADDSRQLTAEATNAQGEVLERDLVWSSSDETVATVSELGQILAVGPGQALITAETEGGNEQPRSRHRLRPGQNGPVPACESKLPV